MKQDIKFNVWVLFSAIIQALSGAFCFVVGALVSIMGIIKPSKLLKINEIKFLVKQKWLINLQTKLFGGELFEKYLFLISGILIAVTGIIVLILAILELRYVKKYSVVNHRVKLIIFALIPLIIAGCVEAYLLLQYDVLKSSVEHIKNIRIACFGVCGVFSVCAICTLLGVLFSKSEEFVSNDNNKYAFEGPRPNRVVQQGGQPSMTIRNQSSNQMQGRAVNVQNPNVRRQPMQQSMPARGQVNPTNMIARPTRPANGAGMTGTGMVRPAARPGVVPMSRNTMASANQMQNSISPRQVGAPNSQSGGMRPTQIRRCPKCGKALMPNEIRCSICGMAERK